MQHHRIFQPLVYMATQNNWNQAGVPVDWEMRRSTENNCNDSANNKWLIYSIDLVPANPGRAEIAAAKRVPVCHWFWSTKPQARQTKDKRLEMYLLEDTVRWTTHLICENRQYECQHMMYHSTWMYSRCHVMVWHHLHQQTLHIGVDLNTPSTDYQRSLPAGYNLPNPFQMPYNRSWHEQQAQA